MFQQIKLCLFCRQPMRAAGVAVNCSRGSVHRGCWCSKTYEERRKLLTLAKAESLTVAQLQRLATKLISTNKNLYGVCRTEYNVDADDATFDRLKKICKIFACEACGNWFELEQRFDMNLGDFCIACYRRYYAPHYYE